MKLGQIWALVSVIALPVALGGCSGKGDARPDKLAQESRPANLDDVQSNAHQQSPDAPSEATADDAVPLDQSQQSVPSPSPAVIPNTARESSATVGEAPRASIALSASKDAPLVPTTELVAPRATGSTVTTKQNAGYKHFNSAPGRPKASGGVTMKMSRSGVQPLAPALASKSANPLRSTSGAAAPEPAHDTEMPVDSTGAPLRFPDDPTDLVDVASLASGPHAIASNSVEPAMALPAEPPSLASKSGQSSSVVAASAQIDRRALNIPKNADVATVRFATDRRPLVELLPNRLQVFAPAAAVLLVLCGLSLGCLLTKRFRAVWMFACAAASTVLVLTTHSNVVRLQQVSRLAKNNQAVFTTERYDAIQGYPLHLGKAIVSLPPMHQKGKMESVDLTRFEFVETATKHIVLHQVDLVKDTDKWFGDLRGEVDRQAAAQQPPLVNGTGAFIFVHGYNVRFDDALKRTAQLSHDLGISGPAICYSWPSKGNVAGYSADESTVNWSAPHLERLILDLRERSNIQSINLIAHSMGNRALLQAVERLHLRLSSGGTRKAEPIIDRLVMAAPDVDAQAFSGRYAESLEGAVANSTLYFSSADRALWLSRLIHGGQRIGLNVVTRNIKNLEAVDIGPQAFFSTGHSYYGSDPAVIDDLSAVLCEHAGAAQRPWLQKQRVASAEFWLLDRQLHANTLKSTQR